MIANLRLPDRSPPPLRPEPTAAVRILAAQTFPYRAYAAYELAAFDGED